MNICVCDLHTLIIILILIELFCPLGTLVPQLFKQRLTISEAKISYRYCIVLREKPGYRIDIVSNEQNVLFKGDLDRVLESKSSIVGDCR